MFGATLAAAGVVHVLMLAHARSAKLGPDLPAPSISVVIAVVFAISVPVALVSTTVAQFIWLATMLRRYPLRRLGRGAATSE